MIERHLTERICRSLHDAPVVYLQGARQTGKSTLVQSIAEHRHPAKYYSLDSVAVLSAVENDPEGFVSGLDGPTVIDEVQRVPSLLLAIKAAVDAQRKPGRFLLTGSASVLALPKISDSLVGRMELHTLWPFTQGELESWPETFLEKVFQKTPHFDVPPKLSGSLNSPKSEAELLQRVLVGGYPEATVRKDRERRNAWFDSYVTTLLHRDVRDLAHVEKLTEIPRLLQLLASRMASLLNYADIARSLSFSQSTLKRYMALLETVFLIRLLPAWAANIGKRLIKSPKLLFTDTGLLSHVIDLDLKRLQSDRTLLGHLMENFVAMELLKQLGWSKKKCHLYHFRTETGREVDLVLEDPAGQIVGIEVKSTIAVNANDLKGLKALEEIAGKRFLRGIVLHLGSAAVPFAKNMHAIPVHCLWI
jgi:predicted AAA+ superfamily ATPase